MALNHRDIRENQLRSAEELEDYLLRQTDYRLASYWWLSCRLIRADRGTKPERDGTDPPQSSISPYPDSSDAHTKSHVYYAWQKLFHYPAPQDQVNIRFTGISDDVIFAEQQQWIHYAVELGANESSKEHLSAMFSAAQTILNCLTSVSCSDSITSYRGITGVNLQYSSDGELCGAKYEFHWLDHSCCVNASPTRSAYKIFYAVLGGLPKTDRKQLGLLDSMLSFDSFSDHRPQTTYTEELASFLNALTLIGFEEDDVRSLMSLIFALLHMTQVHWEEREGKLLMHGDKHLESAAAFLQFDATNLKNFLILKVKYSGPHKIIEGYKMAHEVTRDRNCFMGYIYGALVEAVIRKINSKLESDRSSKIISLLVAPAPVLEPPQSETEDATVHDYSDFVKNLSFEYLNEAYSEFTEFQMVSSQQMEGLNVAPLSKFPTTYSTLLLAESSKKAESFFDKLLAGFAKKNTLPDIHSWLKKYGKLNQKVRTFRKSYDVFGFQMFDFSKDVRVYDLRQICEMSLRVNCEEITEFMRTAEHPFLSGKLYDCPVLLYSLKEYLVGERTEFRNNPPLFVHCLHVDSTNSGSSKFISLTNQLKVSRLADLLQRENYPESLRHAYFLKRFACLSVNSYTQGYEVNPSTSEFILHRLGVQGAHAGLNHVFLTSGHLRFLDERLAVYHGAVLILQTYLRRWRAHRHFTGLKKQADDYKMLSSETLLASQAERVEFEKFVRESFFVDSERADRKLLQSLFLQVTKRTPKEPEFWACLLVMEFDKVIHATLLQTDLCLISGSSESKGPNYVPLGTVMSKLTDDSAKRALKKLTPGILLEIDDKSNISMEVKSHNLSSTISMWGYWLDFCRNLVGDLRQNRGVIPDGEPTTIFDSQEHRRTIALALITKEIPVADIELDCVFPIIISGYSRSLHDSPLWLLVVDLEALEAIKTKETQHKIRKIVASLTAVGDDTSARAWSKISNRELYSKDTDVKSQLLLMEKRKEESGVEEDMKMLLQDLETSRVPTVVELPTGGKAKRWSKQLFQEKKFSQQRKPKK